MTVTSNDCMYVNVYLSCFDAKKKSEIQIRRLRLNGEWCDVDIFASEGIEALLRREAKEVSNDALARREKLLEEKADSATSSYNFAMTFIRNRARQLLKLGLPERLEDVEAHHQTVKKLVSILSGLNLETLEDGARRDRERLEWEANKEKNHEEAMPETGKRLILASSGTWRAADVPTGKLDPPSE